MNADKIDTYMEHSKNKIILCLILGVMEFMNSPRKVLYLFIPIGAYIFALFNRERFTLPLLPAAIQPVYELCINILLVTVCALLVIAVIITIGRKVYNQETSWLREAFSNLHTYQNEAPVKLCLIYKRKRNGITVRKIYSLEIVEAWNERSREILQKFNAHFVGAHRFQYAKGNSHIIIMCTADGIEKPIKAEQHDSALDRDIEEMDNDTTRI